MEKESYERLFNRIDPYHSVAYLTEELHPDSPFWEDKECINKPPIVKDWGFPSWQDALQTVIYADDDYTYVANYSICYDGHEAPMHVCSVLRLDKTLEEDRQGETFGVTESAIYYDEDGM